MTNLYALIMAGGGGTRLWPESRMALPKQFIPLFGECSLIRIAFDRITPLIPPERVLVVTGQRYAETVSNQLPGLPAENVIVEPAGRNTAPAIGLGAIHLFKRDPSAVMAVLTADHMMHKENVFRSALEAAHTMCDLGSRDAAAPGWIVTLGITPSGPETGYGYIERGKPLETLGEHTVFEVTSFREKPDRTSAEQFVHSGRFYWNSGMFIWQVSTVLNEIARQLPNLYAALMKIQAALGTRRQIDVTQQVWETIHPISIDYGVMESAQDVAVLPVDPGWNDVGSWSAVFEESRHLAENEGDNVMQGCEHIAVDTHNCLIRGKRLIATAGLRDLIIVETDDAIFVCPHSEAQQVKKVVNRLREDGRLEYL